MCVFFFFKQKTAYEMRISDWSSDVCSSDLLMGDADTGRPRCAHHVLEMAFDPCLQAFEGDFLDKAQHLDHVARHRVHHVGTKAGGMHTHTLKMCRWHTHYERITFGGDIRVQAGSRAHKSGGEKEPLPSPDATLAENKENRK